MIFARQNIVIATTNSPGDLYRCLHCDSIRIHPSIVRHGWKRAFSIECFDIDRLHGEVESFSLVVYLIVNLSDFKEDFQSSDHGNDTG